MSDSQRILWVDNDPAYIKPFAGALRRDGFEVLIATTAAEAEKLLGNNGIDLLILDVMIPTKTDQEEEIYPPTETENGLKTGLVFYKRMRHLLEQKGIPVLVLSVRVDKEIKREFESANLPPGSFATKMEVRTSKVFLHRIKNMLNLLT